ncbi:hypothetical protein JCM24511_04666 [Saitozyma sp. JCM 24511]|nr:hypothetical protein JCM24511_04666 [Saitozyma sp. JCM 24511]
MPTTIRKTLLLFLALGMLASTGAAMTLPKPDSLQPGYSNRIVLIRHAEKCHGATTIGPSLAQGGDDGSDRPRRGPWGPPRGGGGRGGQAEVVEAGLVEVGEVGEVDREAPLFGASSEYNFGLIFAAPRDEVEKDTERTYATVSPLAKDLGLEINIECWKHFDLNIIATALGAPNAKQTYPGDRNDLIWIMQSGAIVEKRSMHCPGIDDERKDEGDPDLEVEQPRPQPQSSPVGVVSSWLGLLGRVGAVWRAQTRELQGGSES